MVTCGINAVGLLSLNSLGSRISTLPKTGGIDREQRGKVCGIFAAEDGRKTGIFIERPSVVPTDGAWRERRISGFRF